MEKGGSTTIGNHEKAISTVCSMSSTEEPWSSSLFGCIASGSWDGSVKLWDVRQPQHCKPVSEVSLGAKVFGMDWVDHTLMVCTSGRKIHMFDVRKASDPDSFTISETVQREVRMGKVEGEDEDNNEDEDKNEGEDEDSDDED